MFSVFFADFFRDFFANFFADFLPDFFLDFLWKAADPKLVTTSDFLKIAHSSRCKTIKFSLFFLIETSERHTATDLVKFYYLTGFF